MLPNVVLFGHLGKVQLPLTLVVEELVSKVFD